jgi:hypothetical protein
VALSLLHQGLDPARSPFSTSGAPSAAAQKSGTPTADCSACGTPDLSRSGDSSD